VLACRCTGYGRAARGIQEKLSAVAYEICILLRCLEIRLLLGRAK
jgi:hypothetical protein